MNILVTGAYGQLGRELNELVPLFPGWKFVFTDIDQLDITDESKVKVYFNEQQPDFVINCAAYTAVDKAESEENSAFKINAVAPAVLAKYTLLTKAKLIHVSTDYVFDGSKNRPYSENDQVKPVSIYGKTKLQGEVNCMEANPDSIIIRTSWLYSSFGNNFVKTMLRLAGERSELKVVFDQTGTPTYAADLARSVLDIISYSKSDSGKWIPGIYHYSNEGVTSWYDFARTIFELSGKNCKVLPVLSVEFPTPAYRPAYSVLNKSKIKNTFSLEIPFWRDSLKKCLDKIIK